MPMLRTVQDHRIIGHAGNVVPRQMLTASIKLTNPDRVVTQDFPVACHIASLFWLYTDMHGATPPGDAHIFDSIADRLKTMMPFGKRILANGKVKLTPGSLVMFVHNGVADHTCIAIDPHVIAGYNQTGWFAGGLDHAYSSHLINTLRAGTGADSKKVIRSSGGAYDLYEIPEHKAKGLLH